MAGIISGAPAFSFRRIRRLSVSLYHRRNRPPRPKCTNAVSNASCDSNQPRVVIIIAPLSIRSVYSTNIFNLYTSRALIFSTFRYSSYILKSNKPFHFHFHSPSHHLFIPLLISLRNSPRKVNKRESLDTFERKKQTKKERKMDDSQQDGAKPRAIEAGESRIMSPRNPVSRI